MNDIDDIGTKNEEPLTQSFFQSPEISPLSDIKPPKEIQSQIAQINKEKQAAIIALLYKQEREKNTLSKAQFLIDEQSIDKNHPELKKQAQQISHYIQLNEIFSQRQNEVLEYLALIRTALKETPPTVENIRNILITWKDQLVELHKRNAGIPVVNYHINLHPASKIEIPKTSKFLSFLEHCLNKNASTIILNAIAFEIINTKPDEELTQADILLAQAPWDQKLNEQYNRLKNHTSEEVIAKIKNWYEQIPLPLTDTEKEAIESNNPHPYHPDESKKDREMRIQYISGCKPRRDQLNKASVVRSLEKAAKKNKIPHSDPRGTYVKRMCELADHDRVGDMQLKLGIIPLSRCRDTYWGVLQGTVSGSLNYQTEFTGARLDPDQPLSFKERKKLAIESLTPLFARRNKERPCVKEALSKAKDPAETLSSIISQVRKLKL